METIDKVKRLIKAATGDEYGDGMMVTNVATGYAEPGYSSDETIVVFGDWNDKQPYADRQAGLPLTKAQTVGSRLFDALDKIDGVECEWLDEWDQCQECWRAVRIVENSYTWTQFGAWIEDVGIVCGDCLKKDIPNYLDDYTNNSDKAITWAKGSDLEAIGYEQWAPGDPESYQSGWYGREDSPSKVLETIHGIHSDAEVVFLIDDTNQFHVNFSAYVKTETLSTVHFHAGTNMPGYLPDNDEPDIFDSLDDARSFMADEMIRDIEHKHEESLIADDDDAADLRNDIQELQDDIQVMHREATEEDGFTTTVRNRVYWIRPCTEKHDDE